MSTTNTTPVKSVLDHCPNLRLSHYIESINHKSAQLEHLKGLTVLMAIELGRELGEVKTILPHGEFMPWVTVHTSVNPGNANKYIKLSKEHGDISLRTDLSNVKLSKLFLALGAPDTMEQVISDDGLAREEITKLAQVERALIEEQKRTEDWRVQNKRHMDTIRALEIELSQHGRDDQKIAIIRREMDSLRATMVEDRLKHLLELKRLAQERDEAKKTKDPNKELQKDLVRKQNEIEALRSNTSSPETRRALVLAQIKWHSDQVALHNKSLVTLQEELSSLSHNKSEPL